MGTILLFYKYVNIKHPKQVLKWQRTLCDGLGLTGRIILANEGINGTVGGTIKAANAYKQAMEESVLFQGIDFKDGPGDAKCFPRMRIVVKEEIVNLGIDPEKLTVEQGGKHLTPKATHELLNNKPENLVIIDCRNNYEWKVGNFRDAIKPNIKHFRDFPKYIDEHKSEYKDKEVLMYCTGGIRCERASAYVKQATNAKQVYQVEGGIHRYVEQFPDGHFRGKNYVFDERIAVPVTNEILSNCTLCPVKCDTYTNCWNVGCNAHIIVCNDCIQKYGNTCGQTCSKLLKNKKVKSRIEYEQHREYQKKCNARK